MKRLFPALCALLLLIPAFASATAPALRGYDEAAGYQYVAMGTYPQEADGSAHPILWRVLTVRSGVAFLLTEYVLGNGYVHPDDKEFVAFGPEWNKTLLFARLNGEFAGAAFTGAERARIRDDLELGAVFLVDSNDLRNPAYGFTDNASRIGYGTPYALANGLFRYNNGSSPYWTRTPSEVMASGVRCLKLDGSIGYIRCVVKNEGFRPAIWLKLDEPFAGGQGTFHDPFYF